MINDPNKPFDIVINWEDCTWRSHNKTLSDLINNYSCLNAQCRDISKKRVQSLFEEVFGYPLAVDPLTYRGECVMKSNENYAHDGEVIKCPVQKTNDDFVYQKLINNRFGNKFVEDIRIPFFKDKIPFVILKYRHFDNRFAGYFKSIMADVDKILSQDEIKNIIRYSQKIGLEYGELDALRDKNDGRIYIVDVNNTPASPRYFSLKEYWRVLKNMAESFEEIFASEKNRNG